MVLRNTDVYEHIRHVLGGSLSSEISALSILQEAADWLSGAHTWRFLGGKLVKLDFRGIVTVTNATYTHATRTLNLAGAFDDYEFVAQDRFEASSGTGITNLSAQGTRDFEIESKTDGDNIVLASPGLGAAADGASDVTGRIPNDTIALPDDFLQVRTPRGLSATNSIVSGIKWTTPDELLRLRTTQVEVESSWQYKATIIWVVDVNGLATPVLDVHPIPQDNAFEQLSMFYRRRIVVGAEDTSLIPIPSSRPLIGSLLIAAARIFALGYEEGDEAENPSLDDMLDQLKLGSRWRAAIKQDGLTQPSMGLMRGGAVQGMSRGRGRVLLSSEVDAPS